MIETKKVDNKLIVQIKESDRLNATVAEVVKASLTDILSKSGVNAILNLSNVKFIDSTGIGVLLSALKTARQNDNKFALCGIQKDVMSLLSLMKLDKVFDFATESECGA